MSDPLDSAAEGHKPHIHHHPPEKPGDLDLWVEPLALDDLPAAYHLGEKLFRSDTSRHMYRTWDEREVVAFFQEDPELCLGAFVEVPGKSPTDPGRWKLVGFVLGSEIAKRGKPWTYGYLVWFGVDPAFQRHGVGQELFDAFKEELVGRDTRMMIVDTAASNTSAIRFFERQGFGDPEDFVYMSLNLDEARKRLEARKKQAAKRALDALVQPAGVSRGGRRRALRESGR